MIRVEIDIHEFSADNVKITSQAWSQLPTTANEDSTANYIRQLIVAAFPTPEAEAKTEPKTP